jgi:hypothetical protein
MPENSINLQPEDSENVERNNENSLDMNNGQFESDTQRIIRRHLENKDDIITDDDIASVRVGMSPPQFDEATAARFEGEGTLEEAEEDSVEGTEDMSEDENLDEKQITPWDTLDPKE